MFKGKLKGDITLKLKSKSWLSKKLKKKPKSGRKKRSKSRSKSRSRSPKRSPLRPQKMSLKAMLEQTVGRIEYQATPTFKRHRRPKREPFESKAIKFYRTSIELA